MRHALLRFLNVLGVKCSWHVPVVNPSVFRITKNMVRKLILLLDDMRSYEELAQHITRCGRQSNVSYSRTYGFVRSLD